jgi:hypothetical protein
MPDTNDFHGMKNILFNNDDWMVVDPLDYKLLYITHRKNLKVNGINLERVILTLL